ncbi:hypothetical protein J27TS7_23520 [Paenibacillus dendritiformis]|uniref:hypothetical protein n=1 Tax=Paenibacillus dendritiformis TaxID=130049 RepID=UPI00143D9503|nr:hypothetical protein [Paenibacillus dendritiformis]NKI22260.1 hypothetical protein [Paenibacillus dendritiformis]NRF99168.1 hypothetical protein [Paenibacillus dendritiformis]GIO72838.1 hypothetical protein J27TS7_23520 [Paenibacillus dendritiformis]
MLKWILAYFGFQFLLFLILLLIARKKDRRLKLEQAEELPDGCIPTREIFRDPSTGQIVAVYYHPATGKRYYLQEAAESKRRWR